MNAPGVRLSFDRLLRLGVDALPVGLVDAAARRRLLQARVELGASFTFGAFELRLEGDDRVDALACVAADDDGLAAVPVDVPLALAAAVEHWRSSERARAAISALWVELDCVADVDSAPFSFLRFSHDADDDDVVDAAVAVGTSPAGVQRLRALLAHLDGDARVLHVAHVGQRHGAGGDDPGVRVHLGARPDDVAGIVAPFVFAGAADRLTPLLTTWPAGRALGVQLDLLPASSSSFVDLELYLPTSPLDPGADGGEAWRPALAAIADRAVVDADRLTLVEQWPTRVDEPPPVTWPMTLWRTLQVKLRLHRDGSAAAKAYLAFSPRFRV